MGVCVYIYIVANNHVTDILQAGPDLRGANWAVAKGPPQLRGFHK